MDEERHKGVRLDALVQVARAVRRSWIGVLIATLLGVGLGVANNALEPPTYTATSTLFLSVQAGGPSDKVYQGKTFLQTRTESYAALVTSPRALEEISRELGGPLTGVTLSAEVVPDTALIQVSAVDGSPDRAAAIANAAATALSHEIQRIETGESAPGDGAFPLHATVTKPAIAPTSPSSPNVPLNLGRVSN